MVVAVKEHGDAGDIHGRIRRHRDRTILACNTGSDLLDDTAVVLPIRLSLRSCIKPRQAVKDMVRDKLLPGCLDQVMPLVPLFNFIQVGFKQRNVFFIMGQLKLDKALF